MLISALTGCRPAELEKGVRVHLKKPEDLKGFIVEFDIHGAKLSDQKGQETRRITYNPDDKNKLLSDFLGSIDLFEHASFEVSIKSAGNFSKEVTRISNLIWPAHKEIISAYCFRHQFSSDLKKHYCGNDVSMALGHASSKTRKIYGSASQSRGQLPQLSISASRDVKNTASNKKNSESNEP
jgi:integrase